jgi:actin-related protein 5
MKVRLPSLFETGYRVSDRRGGAALTEDDFGADDADWQIYRKINLGAPDESEEEDIARLGVIEKQLLEYDPTFSLEQTYALVSTATSKLLAAFRPGYSEGDARGHARIHLNVERWRVPEVWFSPGMAGVDSAGLGEAITFVLGKFKPEHRLRMAKVSLGRAKGNKVTDSPRLFFVLG